ncbi:ATP-binding protein [Halomonas alkalisoli]|uniref:ATP-binding protein n=1 Tax=Halomonas alkalisoli TaxID=2907158 RepID=UPI001F452768|nr:ATP-binding protein [Halomonas alkalisoli]MCE9681143.1 ATP-binding protein [Halomonas alkalisoli]
MMTQPLLDTLRHLKLTGMHDALAHQLTQPDTYDLPFEDCLGMLLDREVLHRDNRRLDRLLHSTHRLTLKGESMRKNTAPKTAEVDPS